MPDGGGRAGGARGGAPDEQGGSFSPAGVPGSFRSVCGWLINPKKNPHAHTRAGNDRGGDRGVPRVGGLCDAGGAAGGGRGGARADAAAGPGDVRLAGRGHPGARCVGLLWSWVGFGDWWVGWVMLTWIYCIHTWGAVDKQITQLEPQVEADTAGMDPMAVAIRQKMQKQVGTTVVFGWFGWDWGPVGWPCWVALSSTFSCISSRAATEGEGEGQGHLQEGA